MPRILQDVQSTAEHLEHQFLEPSWTAPLDTASAIQALPAQTTLSGMFFEAVVAAARAANATLPSAQARYVPFRFYPLREFARLLVEAAPALYPDEPIRQALRLMGRAAPYNLLSSTVGKVVLGPAQGIHAILGTISQTYPINLRPSQAELLESGERFAVVRLTEVHYFLDCHHVGILEGTLRYAGQAHGSVRIRPMGRGAMDYLCTW
jgi:uncharacterized protein (TIGR02265 family)